MIRLEEHKHETENKTIETAPLPASVVIPLLQHLGKPLDILKVKVGDTVKRGQCLATSDKGVFAPVHASISGRVSAVATQAHPLSGTCRAVVIEGDGQDAACDEMRERSPEAVDALSPDDLRRIIFEAGIVGLGGAAFPTHIKLHPPGPIEYFILNGAECEPYLTTDHRLMVEKTDEIVRGMRLVLKILDPKECVIAIEDNKPEAIRLFRERAAAFNWKVVVLKTAYPQGGEKQVIASCLKREVPSGKLPFDIGVVVHNAGTVYAITEAVYSGKPLYERVVTVAGPCVARPKNLLVRLGTRIRDLAALCGPLVKDPKKIVMGGPMMGVAQYTMDGPVIKATSGVLFFDEAAVEEQQEDVCIRCGECLQSCPVGLNPSLIAQAIEKNKLGLAEEYGIMDCIECGLCAWACPGRRNIVQAIKTAKARIKSGKK